MLTLSHFLTRRILHLRYYCWLVISRATADVNLLECALLVACGLCPFDPFTPVKVESSLLNGHSLFLSSPWYNRTRLTGRKTPTYLLLSLSLSSLSLTHSYCTFSLSLSLCLIVNENSSVVYLCRMGSVQHNHIYSTHWLFTHPFACRNIHIQLTIRSYHRHTLSYHYTRSRCK